MYRYYIAHQTDY